MARTGKAEAEGFVRFSPRQRLEHALVMTLFLVLAVTGFPQKFHDSAWAQPVVDLLGGLERMRFFHRAAGFLFALLAAVHVAMVVRELFSGRARLSMVPTRKDFRDAVTTLRYYLGVSDLQARFDRFDYRQKFEYWGLLLGGRRDDRDRAGAVLPGDRRPLPARGADPGGEGGAQQRRADGVPGRHRLAHLQRPPVARGVPVRPQHLHGTHQPPPDGARASAGAGAGAICGGRHG